MSCTNCNPTFRALSASHSADLEMRLRSNHQATSAEAIQISEMLSDAKADVLRCDAEISRLHSVIISLENARKELHMRVHSYNSILAPIRKLPTELLGTVFSYCCGANQLEPDGELPILLALSTVCAHWRSIVLSSPGLWSTVSVKDNFYNIQLFNMYLERSAPSPLTIAVRTIHSELMERRILESIIAHSRRWLDISIEFEDNIDGKIFAPLAGNLPLLERLSLTNVDIIDDPDPLDVFETTPHLHTLSLGNSSHAPVTLPWDQITDLKRIDCGINEFLDDLRRCPNLKSGHMSASYHSDMIGSATSHIRTFSMEMSIPNRGLESMALLFGAVTFPSVESITLRMSRIPIPEANIGAEWPQAIFGSFLARSSCKITTLSLDHVPVSDTHLILALASMESLTHLTIEETGSSTSTAPNVPTITNNLLQSLKAYPSSPFESYSTSPLVPNLQFLRLHAHGCTFSDLPFVNVVKSRWSPVGTSTGNKRVKCLRSVKLRITGRFCDVPAFEPLQHMKRTGMKIDVSARSFKM